MKINCLYCRGDILLKKNGTLRTHYFLRGVRCIGSQKLPSEMRKNEQK